jgi:hypothetical protein
MGSSGNLRLAIRGITAAVSLGVAFTAGAQVMNRAPAAPPGGVAQLNPNAACVSNPAPRIGNINGTQSGIVLQPGSELIIAGCGFGRSGQVYLSGGGTTVPLKIDSWGESIIRAQVEPTLGGLPDFGGVKVNIKPNGLPVISSIETNSFKAAREQVVVAIPPGVVGVYSGIYGPPTVTSVGLVSQISGKPIARILRSHLYPGGFCPAVTDQAGQMTDSWPADFLASGFSVSAVNYRNETDAKNWNTQQVQWVAVGNDGSARYDATQKRVFATFQGSSMYVKKGGTLETIVNAAFNPVKLYESLKNSGSACTSSYTLSLSVTGPRGISPFK